MEFRLSNQRLPVQQKRSLRLPKDERICIIRNSGEVGGEYDNVLNCSNENAKNKNKQKM